MAGLALGSRIFGRLIDLRPIQLMKAYALLEAGIGIYNLLLPLLLRLADPVFGALYATAYDSFVLLSLGRPGRVGQPAHRAGDIDGWNPAHPHPLLHPEHRVDRVTCGARLYRQYVGCRHRDSLGGFPAHSDRWCPGRRRVCRKLESDDRGNRVVSGPDFGCLFHERATRSVSPGGSEDCPDCHDAVGFCGPGQRSGVDTGPWPYRRPDHLCVHADVDRYDRRTGLRRLVGFEVDREPQDDARHFCGDRNRSGFFIAGADSCLWRIATLGWHAGHTIRRIVRGHSGVRVPDFLRHHAGSDDTARNDVSDCREALCALKFHAGHRGQRRLRVQHPRGEYWVP